VALITAAPSADRGSNRLFGSPAFLSSPPPHAKGGFLWVVWGRQQQSPQVESLEARCVIGERTQCCNRNYKMTPLECSGKSRHMTVSGGLLISQARSLTGHLVAAVRSFFNLLEPVDLVLLARRLELVRAGRKSQPLTKAN